MYALKNYSVQDLTCNEIVRYSADSIIFSSILKSTIDSYKRFRDALVDSTSL